MDDFIKLLNEELEYISHKIIADTIYIEVFSTKKELECPFCGQSSSKVHSRYERSFQDLPIQGKKVVIIIRNRKMFCNNMNCLHTTFAESFEFLPFKGKKTKRLEDEIINISINVSSITAAKLLNNSIAKVGKSTVCNLLKKRYPNN